MHVVVNAAMSADGKLSTRRREQVTISGPADFDRVDAMRAASDAVMVGVGTVLADDPSLTVDDPERRQARSTRGEPANPRRVVADSRLRTPQDATVLDDSAETVFLTSASAAPEAVSAIEAAGATVLSAGQTQVDLTAGFAALADRGIDDLMVEGGGTIVFSLFEADLVDELSIYVGSQLIGGRDAPTLADGEGFVENFPDLDLETVERLDDGVLLTYAVPAR